MTCCGNCRSDAGCSCSVCGGLCHFKFLSKAATAKHKPQKGLTGEELDTTENTSNSTENTSNTTENTSNTTKNTSNPDSPPKRVFVDMDMEGGTENCCFGCNYKWTCGICG